MEDLIGLIFVVIFFVIKIASSARKSSTSTTKPASVGSNSNRDAAREKLKSVLSAIKEEFEESTVSESSELYSELEEKRETSSSYTTDEEYYATQYEDEMKAVEKEIVRQSKYQSAPAETRTKRSSGADITRKRLRNAFIWREIVDRPVSER
jgi:hypothetical protein